jgi:hypothetical protein
MIGRQFTTEKANELEGVFFNEDTFFHFSQDDNDNYFLVLNEDNEIDLANSEYSWILELPLIEFKLKINPPPF